MNSTIEDIYRQLGMYTLACAEELNGKKANREILDWRLNDVSDVQNRGLWSATGYQLHYDYNLTVS